MKVENNVGPLAGKTFLITGTLSAVRKEVEKLIEDADGKILSGVSKKLNYLVVGEDPGSKVEKAEYLGIPMISEEELMEMIGE